MTVKAQSYAIINMTLIPLENVMRHFKQHLKRNPYYTNREWQYKNIKPRILIEEKVELFRGKMAYSH
ncbi:hypothetical protein [Enterobacter cloacae complex sp. 288G10]|uniref:hypothetical protein n=1 Tax=Enterobacter cloacae complex sp. 288G10 TaxID=3395859 RepID=UPI003CF5C974